ncbi:TetR family transcriptional regulator [Paenarthrobacter nitroguajacolicus]|uniref:TetR/AcrR family transcriptional regulator n=1 Tax=Paenarthrobacter nitroguajacolicus TaxID=211146 RepID=UPI0015BB9785|nr:TetR/AcrR family transcriptional regulator [Paenarthrobacter nitroguajacolicus]NWL10040.1 TetR family transcriptional regulator [Paenarthrobacter nitroguajacolicus]
MQVKMRREERREQLLTVAWSIVREGGADLLTLGRLAERAHVTKPVVYDHFPSRPALLMVLYKEFDDQQTEKLEHALRAAPRTLQGQAQAIARSHVDCVLAHGNELVSILGAVEGTPELERLKLGSEAAYADLCQAALRPYASKDQPSRASIIAIIGAAEALAQAAVRQEIPRDEAIAEITTNIVLNLSR